MSTIELVILCLDLVLKCVNSKKCKVLLSSDVRHQNAQLSGIQIAKKSYWG